VECKKDEKGLAKTSDKYEEGEEEAEQMEEEGS
jgi:hypothetical protein